MVVNFTPVYTLENLAVNQTAIFNEIYFQSYTGPLNLKGSTGAQGNAGPTGSAGAKGATGASGGAGPTGAGGAIGPTGAGLGYATFNTGGIVYAQSSTGLYTSSHLTYTDNNRQVVLDGQIEIVNRQVTGAVANQFVYNSYGYRTYEFFAPTSGANAIQTFTTDPLVNEVVIETWGAGGQGGFGGNGGYSKSTISGLSGANTFKIWVGDSGEGGTTLGQPQEVPTIILATGPARYYEYSVGGPVNTGYSTSISFFITGATGSQVYYIGTVYGTGQFGFPGAIPLYTGSDVLEWNYGYTGIYGSLTGTIFATGSYPYGGYSYYMAQVYETSIQNNVAVNTGPRYIIAPSTGADKVPATGGTGNNGGGASFVYMQTGSQYVLTNVAGGGGGTAIFYGPFSSTRYVAGIGGNSATDAPNISVQTQLLPYSQYNPYGAKLLPTSACGKGASGSQTGAPGISNTGTTFYSGYGGTQMPLLTSNVSGNISATGGCGQYKDIDIAFPYYETFNPNRMQVVALGCGGGGNGFCGGGGGGLFVSNGLYVPYPPPNPATGYAGGGGGGSNYSSNGFTLQDGFHQGNYIPQIVQSDLPGYVRIQTFGYINPAYTISTSGTTQTNNIDQTPGFSMLGDGTSFFSKNVAIGKTNPEYLLDVQGDISTIGNIQISNFQNIFKNPNFDPVLYDIIKNNFNYSNTQDTVSLNYSLASLSLNIGYIENALSGLGNMLGFAFGTYNENGDLTDIPFWLKQWLANYYPLSTSGLTNYTLSRYTSSNPSRQYYLDNEELIPFGKWVYYYSTLIAPDTLFAPYSSVGMYVEDNKYYVFSKTGSFTQLKLLANLYVQNSVYGTNNPYLLAQYNDPTGAYKYNILNDTYSAINTQYQIGVQNLVIYTQYAGINPSRPTIDYAYNPFDPVLYGSNNLYNPPDDTRFWYNHAFYDLNVFYTGTYSSGYFLNNIRPIPGSTGFKMAYGPDSETPVEKTYMTLELADKMKTFSPWKAVGSTAVVNLAQIQQTPSPNTLRVTNGVGASQTANSIARNANGPVQTTFASNVPTNGTLQGNTNNVSRGISIVK